ncbi:MAG: hypothetical protein EP329_24675 [Deltaproteobacteria bacterium]|nr:MAG: hypothetical protein EP329_24675 [Deltaproteobacteria bacterium]
MKREAPSIWWFAFGYFAAYAPYSALTKAVSKGLLPGMTGGVSGFTMLPATVIASLVGMMVFLTAMGWWKHATKHKVLGFEVPGPTKLTFASGLCTAVIIGTTTLAYTFSGVSIVFMMLLMRGGVLIIAPIVDATSGRKTKWFSWVALLLSLGALVVAFSEHGGYAITIVAAIDVAAYLAGYFFRLRIMSSKAKSPDPAANIRYFVEEQMVGTPAVLVTLAIVALIGEGDVMLEVREGFTTFLTQSDVIGYAIVIGLLSQGTGIFGGLILLDKRENTFCVPVNRSSSILAGVVAAWLLTWLLGNPPPSGYQMAGAGLIILAIAFLSVPPLLARPKAAATAAQAQAPAPASEGVK